MDADPVLPLRLGGGVDGVLHQIGQHRRQGKFIRLAELGGRVRLTGVFYVLTLGDGRAAGQHAVQRHIVAVVYRTGLHDPLVHVPQQLQAFLAFALPGKGGKQAEHVAHIVPPVGRALLRHADGLHLVAQAPGVGIQKAVVLGQLLLLAPHIEQLEQHGVADHHRKGGDNAGEGVAGRFDQVAGPGLGAVIDGEEGRGDDPQHLPVPARLLHRLQIGLPHRQHQARHDQALHQRHHRQPYGGIAGIEERHRSQRRTQHDEAGPGHRGEHRAEIPVAVQQERHTLDEQYADGGEKHLMALAEIREVAHIAQQKLGQVRKHHRQSGHEPVVAQLQKQQQVQHDEREGDAVGQELEQIAGHHLTGHTHRLSPLKTPSSAAGSPALCPGQWVYPSHRP